MVCLRILAAFSLTSMAATSPPRMATAADSPSPSPAPVPSSTTKTAPAPTPSPTPSPTATNHSSEHPSALKPTTEAPTSPPPPPAEVSTQAPTTTTPDSKWHLGNWSIGKKDVGIAAGSVAGAAALAGGIAGIVEAFTTTTLPALEPVKKQVPDVAPGDDIPLLALPTFFPEDASLQGIKGSSAVPPSMKEEHIRLYDKKSQDSQEHARTLTAGMTVGVAGFSLALGSLFLGISAVVYCKSRGNKKRHTTQLDPVSEYEEEASESEQELLV